MTAVGKLHRVQRFVGTGLLVATLVGCSLFTGKVRAGHVPHRAHKGSAQLTWAPPQCGDAAHRCEDLYLANTGAHQEPALNASRDYRLHLPSHGPLVGGLTIDGGHNVILIGGEIDLTVPCSDSSSDCHGVNISRGSASGEVYIEGVKIRNPDPNYLKDGIDTGDGIDVDDYPGVTDVVLQNVRIEGIKGCDPGVPGAHADVFQPYNAGGASLEIDHLSGTTDCQGMQVDPDLAYREHEVMPRSATFKNVNIDVFSNPSDRGNQYAWWFTYGASSCLGYPVTLIGDYASEPGQSLAHGAVWPDPANGRACGALYSRGAVSWKGVGTINGIVRNGRPARGDFVPAGTAGIHYRSPGYR